MNSHSNKPFKTRFQLRHSASETCLNHVPFAAFARPLLQRSLVLTGLFSFSLLSGCSHLTSQKPDSQDLQTAVFSEPTTQSTENSASHSPLIHGSQQIDKSSAPVVVKIDDPLAELQKQPLAHYDNLWDEIAANMLMGEQHFEDFDEYLNFYLRNQKHLARVSERAKPYLYYILSEVKKRNMPYEIALLPVIESGFRPDAHSHQSAMGLWQFIPQTAHLYGLERNWWYDGRRDVVQSTQAALNYLQKLYELNDNDWLLALASYNGGIGNVWKAAKRYQKKNKTDADPDFWQLRRYLPKETQHYVPQLLAVAHVVKHSAELKIQLEPIENKAFFEVVEIDKQIALNQVASLSDTSNDLLSQLNPGYLRAATPPNGPHHIVLPLENSSQFQNQLDQDPSLFDIQWTRHKVKSGDTLSEIAAKYHTSSSAIRKLNGMKNSNIRIGKTLLIPVPQNVAIAQAAQNRKKTAYQGPKSTHTVRAGESLWTIARYYNVDTKTLCNWNNIGVKTPLRVGQKLEIRSDQYGHQIRYTLKKGDSLWTVAQKFGVTTTQLSGWNKISRKKVLQPGMELIVWQPGNRLAHRKYVVKAGDSLWDIARANNLSTREIARYNQMTENDYLQPGQVIKIPHNRNDHET